MALQLLHVAGEHGLILGRLLAEPADRRLAVGSGTVPPPIPSTIGSLKLVKWNFSMTRAIVGVEGREVHLRPRRIGLGQELHADRVQAASDRRG